MRNLVRCLFATLFVSLVVNVAHAQELAQAQRHFSGAQSAFQKGHYRRAAKEFQLAYDFSHDGVLLYNIAEAWQKGGEGRKAIEAYRAYLKSQPGVSDRKEVERRIHSLEQSAYEVKSQSTQGDDPRTSVPTPTMAAPVTAGPAPGGSPTGEPGRQASDFGTPAPTPEAVAATSTSVGSVEGIASTSPPSKMKIAAWVSLASTVALVTAGAVFSLAAQSRSDEISRRLSFVDATGQPRKFDAAQQAEYNNLKSEGNTYNGLGIGFFAAGGAMAVVSTVLFVVDYKKSHHQIKPVSRRSTVALGLSPGPIATALTWSF